MSLINGLSAAGASIAQTFGQASLEAQRSYLDEEKLKLADALAGARESRGRAEADTYLAKSQDREHGNRLGEQENLGLINERNNAAQSGREHTNRIGEIQEQGKVEGANIDKRAGAEKGVAKYSHDLANDETDRIIALDDDTQVRITKGGQAKVVRYSDGVPLKGGQAGLSTAENRQFQTYLAEHTKADELDPSKKFTDTAAAMADIKANNPQLYKKLRGEQAANAPAPAPVKKPQGAGTKASPFMATTQAEIDWFRASAPAGSIINVNGQLLTK